MCVFKVTLPPPPHTHIDTFSTELAEFDKTTFHINGKRFILQSISTESVFIGMTV